MSQPFPFADDYQAPGVEEPFELRETTPPMSGESTPMTMPQRMHAMEQRQVAQSRDIKALNTKMDQVLKILSWKARAKAVAPLLIPAVAAQFPQAKGWLKALLDIVSAWQ